jgi:predicted  nucleic acid-binding Zn-ribbon protein
MSRISTLYRLQELDTEIDNNRTRIKEINATLADNSELAAMREALEGAEIVLKEARTANSAANHTVLSQREKIEQNNKKLYGGAVTNPKELEELQLESESLKKYLATLEDRYLETMLELDEAEESHIEARDAFDLLEAKTLSESADLDEERGTLTTDIESREQEREAALVDIEPEDVELYDRLRSRLNGIAVTTLSDDSCSVCGLDQARSKLQEIRTGNVIIQCAQCTRILYSG